MHTLDYIAIVPQELSARQIISIYSIRDDYQKIPNDCDKYHVKHDMTIF